MTDQRFRNILEPYLHGFPIMAWSFMRYPLDTLIHLQHCVGSPPPDNLRGGDFSERLLWIINGGSWPYAALITLNTDLDSRT